MRRRRHSTSVRAFWYLWYRQLRIVRRESWKAYEDMVLFGTGFVKIGEDIPDLIRHIPIEEFAA